MNPATLLSPRVAPVELLPGRYELSFSAGMTGPALLEVTLSNVGQRSLPIHIQPGLPFSGLQGTVAVSLEDLELRLAVGETKKVSVRVLCSGQVPLTTDLPLSTDRAFRPVGRLAYAAWLLDSQGKLRSNRELAARWALEAPAGPLGLLTSRRKVAESEAQALCDPSQKATAARALWDDVQAIVARVREIR
jgi:hypothetical protein